MTARAHFAGMAALLSALALPVQLQAQVGTVTGQVLDARTRAPIGAAQVFIEGTGVGRLTEANGRYLLRDVPAGQRTLRVVLLGFQPVVQEIVVTAGETTNVPDILLSEQAIVLDELVATGTPGGTRARAIGNVVAKVDAARVTEVAPVTSVQEMLSSREPGLSVLPGSGNVGTGSVIRIRGYSSLSLSNQPLIYVDGIRVDNNPAAGPNIRQGRQVSKLDDINPEDIASIEIIKGPAAATLYGTEASNGVIQIITKRGVSGAPVYELAVRQGAVWLMDPVNKVPDSYGIDPKTGQLIKVNLYELEREAGRTVFQYGHQQAYGLSVRGGTDAIRYYVSSDWDNNTGIVDYNWQKRLNLRANLNVVANEKLSFDVSTGYVTGKTRFAQAATNWGIWDQFIWGSPLTLDKPTRGFLRATPEAVGTIESTMETDRFIGSFKANHKTFPWLDQRLILGLDVANDVNSILFPRHPLGTAFFFGGQSLGDKTVERPLSRFITLDYATTAAYTLRANMALKSSFGVQYYDKILSTITARGQQFPAPPITTVGGGAVTSAGETFIENKTLGLYVQQEFGYKDRIFLTAAVRGDANSAFGADYKAAIYPKLSATWVLNEEPFWNVEWVNSLKLRSAWGRAGQQPDAFAAVRLYAPATGPGDQPVATPQTIGNPGLGPEVGQELEVGFDAGLFGDRLSANVTYYDRTKKDAILQMPVPPSRGFPGSQWVNLGELKSRGFEATLNGRAVAAENLSWDFGFGVTSTTSEITDMANVPPTATIRVGYPLPSIFAKKVVSAELNANGQAINILCDGGTGKYGVDQGGAAVPCDRAPQVFWGRGHPKWEATLNSTLTARRNLRLYAMVDMRTGHWMNQQDIVWRHATFCVSEACNLKNNPIVQAYKRLGENDQLGHARGGYAKLREVSATYTLPSAWVQRTGASRASVTAAARNLATLWVQQKEIFGDRIADPEMRTPGSDLTTGSMTIIPPLSSFLLTMRITF
jgi:TonB-linked SusC/RagA family outer membrane protein